MRVVIRPVIVKASQQGRRLPYKKDLMLVLLMSARLSGGSSGSFEVSHLLC